jgi:hypothetical protein
VADPRATVDHTGVGQLNATYAIDNSTITFDRTKANGIGGTGGLAVTLSGNNTVARATDGQALVGKLLNVEPDGMATVQVDGYCRLAGGNGATLTRGTHAVGAVDGSANPGYIRSAASGTAAELVRQGPTIHDAADATNAEVKF